MIKKNAPAEQNNIKYQKSQLNATDNSLFFDKKNICRYNGDAKKTRNIYKSFLTSILCHLV